MLSRALPALAERQRAQVGAVEPQEIKRDVGGRPGAPQELVEPRAPGLVGRDHLAVENGLVDAELSGHLLTQGGEAIENIAAP